MMEPWMKPYPMKISRLLRRLLPRFYRRCSGLFSGNVFPDLSYWSLVRVGYVSEGIYLLLPDFRCVLEDLQDFVAYHIDLSELADRVERAIAFNNSITIPTLGSYLRVDAELSDEAAESIEKMLVMFSRDYKGRSKGRSVKQIFRSHAGILKTLAMMVPDFGFPSEVAFWVSSYVSGKISSERLLTEISSIHFSLKGLR